MILRKIKDLKKLEYPRYILFFDTETYLKKYKNKQEKHEFRLGVIIYVELDKDHKITHRDVYHFYKIADFWRYVYAKTSNDHVLYIFAHNVKYDLMSVQFDKGLLATNFNASFPVLGHNFILNAKRGRRKIKILDTFNYVKVRLAKIGKAVGQKKVKLKNVGKFQIYTPDHSRRHDYNLLHKSPLYSFSNKWKNRTINFNNISNEILVSYCENDVEIVEKFIIKFIHFLKDNDLGSLEATAASTAFSVFRHKFNTGEIHYHKDKTLLAFERQAYKGGRTECFYLGKLKGQPFYLFDVNSMYAWVMANCELPIKPVLQSNQLSFNELKQFTKSHYVIADVILSYHSNIGNYGTHYDNKLLFPIGTFNATLHNPELIFALENGHIAAIKKCVVYDKSVCLSAYANYFHQLKSNATNDTDKEFSKLMNNSLYGRFGMRYYDKDVIEDFTGSDSLLGVVPIAETNENGKKVIIPWYRWYGKLVRTWHDETIPKKDTNIALAGAVAAYARMKLLEYILTVGYYNIFYCDTDSLLVNEVGANKLLQFTDKKELGKLKKEMECLSIEINAPKDYQFGLKKRLKGIPSNYTLENGQYEFWQFTTLREYLRNDGSFFGQRQNNKRLTREYNKGIMDVVQTYPYQGFTKPLELNL